jgi:exopolysaccharide biosynthesis polyprenyl glycosylphosphotransferase
METRATESASREKAGVVRPVSVARGPRRYLRRPPSTRETAWNDPLRRRMLAMADVLGGLAAVSAVGVVGSADLASLACAAVIPPVWGAVAKAYGLYDLDHAKIRHLTVEELPKLLHAAILVSAAVALLFAIVDSAELSPQAAVAMWATLVAFSVVGRAAARAAWRRLVPPERTLVIGDGPVARDLARKLSLEPGHHLEVVITLTAEDLERSRGAAADPLVDAVASEGIDRVIVAMRELNEGMLYRVLALCRGHDLKLSVTPPIQAMLGTAVNLTHLAELPIIEFRTWDASRSSMFLKRAFDILVAGPALILLLPLMGLIAAVVRLGSGGPALFIQTRAGREGKPFRMYKFRTMVGDAEERLGEVVQLDQLREPMYKVSSDPRVTPIGRMLRRTSLDELPQLVNVVRGEMSLVGPRPEDVRLAERYSEAELFRLDMRPGITGPMQVHGRGDLSFRERLAVEREYIENYSFAKDMDILCRTAAAVVKGRGAY